MISTLTDAALLEAAIAKAGSLSDLAAATLLNRVTLWRWRRSGRISTMRQRVLLEQYLGAA